jgi:hypothetical protein
LPDIAPWLGVLLAFIALCGTGWIVMGAAVTPQSGQWPELGYLTGSIELFVLAMVLGTRPAEWPDILDRVCNQPGAESFFQHAVNGSLFCRICWRG